VLFVKKSLKKSFFSFIFQKNEQHPAKKKKDKYFEQKYFGNLLLSKILPGQLYTQN